MQQKSADLWLFSCKISKRSTVDFQVQGAKYFWQWLSSPSSVPWVRYEDKYRLDWASASHVWTMYYRWRCERTWYSSIHLGWPVQSMQSFLLIIYKSKPLQTDPHQKHLTIRLRTTSVWSLMNMPDGNKCHISMWILPMNISWCVGSKYVCQTRMSEGNSKIMETSSRKLQGLCWSPGCHQNMFVNYFAHFEKPCYLKKIPCLLVLPVPCSHWRCWGHWHSGHQSKL